MQTQDYSIFKPAKPYFDLVRGALGNLVDGEHFFDCVSDDVIYEVLYDLGGWPRVIEGRADLMNAFLGYCRFMVLRSADHLVKHAVDGGRALVIEYEVHGTIASTSVEYNNRFCSIIKLSGRKIVHWRDYMDSFAAWNAMTAGNR